MSLLRTVASSANYIQFAYEYQLFNIVNYTFSPTKCNYRLRCNNQYARPPQVLLTPPDEGPRVKGERLRLQDIVNGDYSPKKLQGSWMSSHEFLRLNQWNEISLLNVATLGETVVMSNTTYVSVLIEF